MFHLLISVVLLLCFVFGRCTQCPYCLNGLGGGFPFIRLVFSFHLSVFTFYSPPPPSLRSSPCLRGTVCWRGDSFPFSVLTFSF